MRRCPRLKVALVAVTIAALAAAPATAAQPGHHPEPPHDSDGGARVGLLIADHGEPPEYNAWTYASFREFFQHLIDMGVIPSWLAAVDSGTILYDGDCPGCAERSPSPRLVDAWLRPHDGPAAFVPASESLAAHYVLPTGPGLREPDVFEHVGLAAWHEWQRMGGRSPNYDEKLVKKAEVIRRLRTTYGDDLAVRVGYGIDPRIGGGRQGIREALDALVNRDRIESLVVVYHGVGFSDIMQTHHLRHQIADHLRRLGVEIPVRYAEPLGTTDAYVDAVTEKVRAEVAALPPDAAVAVHLSGHGLPTTACGDYDCGADAYHRSSAALFARVRPAVLAAVQRPGRLGVFHIYGDGGEGEADPQNEVAGPIEALEARAREGWTHVIDIPYEFDSNSRDTLIVLRQGYGRPQPDWNPALESHFTYRGMAVKIANASGGEPRKTDALEQVTLDALGAVDMAPPGAGPAAPHGHGGATTGAGGAIVEAIHHRGRAAEPASTPHPDTHSPGGALVAGHGTSTAEDVEHGDHDRPAELAAGHLHGGAGTARATGPVLLLAVLAGGATAMGAAARGRIVAARLAVAAVGVQLGGLAWDLAAHAHAGEDVHLLENGGHWVAMAGLGATGAAALHLLRRPVPVSEPRGAAR